MSNNDNGKKLKEDIIKVIKKHPEGLTATEISKVLGYHRHTITKYILVLEAVGIIYRRRVGSATLHYITNHYKNSKVDV
jgi:predicted transcriptional regulator